MKSKNLENILKSSNVILVSDIHHNLSALDEALKYAEKYKLSLISNGDDFNDYNFIEIANSLGYQLPSVRKMNFFSKNLSQQDLEALMVREEVQKLGVENFVSIIAEQNQIPKKNLNLIVNQVEEILRYSQSELFEKRINKVGDKLIEEEAEQLIQDQLQLRALYEVMNNKQAKSHAELLNKYDTVEVVANKGNHESILYYELVKQYMNNPDNLTVLDEQEGYLDVNGLKVAGMSNSIHLMPYLSEIFDYNEIKHLYPHLIDDNLYELLSDNKEIKKSDLRDLEKKLLKEDKEYSRIAKNVEEGENLDLFLSHGQIREAYLDKSRKANFVAYRLSSAILSDRAKLLVEGHIHSNYEGKNFLGNNVIRPGNKMYVVGKDDSGEIIYNMIDFNCNFDSSKGVEYDLEILKNQVNYLIDMYKSQV